MRCADAFWLPEHGTFALACLPGVAGLNGRRIERQVRSLKGQAAIALSLAIPVMVGAACLAADMLALYRGFARLQGADDTAVLAGAMYLPANPTLARSAALASAQMNGISESEIVYNHPASDGRSITMVIERSVPYHFARLLGLSQSLVTVKAVAGIRGSESAPAGLLPIGIRCDARSTTYQPTILKLAPRRGPALAGKLEAAGDGESATIGIRAAIMDHRHKRKEKTDI